MNETAISWTEVTWNPVSGCEKISSGCAFCYAEKLAEQKRGTNAFKNGFDLTVRPHKLNEPFKLKKPSLVFVNSMSDLFWDKIDNEYRDKIIDVIEQTPQHQYQVLTKRPELMLEYSKNRKLPSNFWAGTTLEHKKYSDRIRILRQIKAEIKFLSIEPMLSDFENVDLSGIDWVIGGGESGGHLHNEKTRKLRGMADKINGKWVPMEEKIWWAQNLRDNCKNNNIQFFWKQWGGAVSHSAGRLLDGRTWDEFPRSPENGKWDTKATRPFLQKNTAA